MFRSVVSPKNTRGFDIRNRLLQFESQHVLHKNDKWSGDRYVCVFFNKEMNYKNCTKCKRSARLRKLPPDPDVFTWLTSPNHTNEQNALRKTFLDILHKTHFPEDRTSVKKPHSKYGKTRGRFLSFGVTQSRKPRTLRKMKGMYTRKNYSPNNNTYHQLFQALSNYVTALYPKMFGTADSNKYHACIVAKNSNCEWHRDAGNLGPCAIISIGDFTGGKLLVEWSSSAKEVFDK